MMNRRSFGQRLFGGMLTVLAAAYAPGLIPVPKRQTAFDEFQGLISEALTSVGAKIAKMEAEWFYDLHDVSNCAITRTPAPNPAP